ncbi:MAG: dihydroneopterin aldolase [Negativicutes bacterium]
MDKITLSNMKFLGYHGCENSEKSNGQIFQVDAEILTDLKMAGQTDSLSDAINYVDVFNKIKTVMEKERYDLLERVAQRLAACVLEESRVDAVIVRIRKPAVPLPGMLDWVQVEIRRDREL